MNDDPPVRPVPRLVTVCIDTYPGCPALDLNGAAKTSRDAVARSLAVLGMEVDEWQGDRAALNDRLSEWAGGSSGLDGGAIESTIVYWVGHGSRPRIGNTESYLLATPSVTSRKFRHLECISGSDLAAVLIEEQQNRLTRDPEAWRIVILDTCESGPGVREMYGHFDPPPTNLLLVGTAPEGGPAFTGDFPLTLQRILESFPNQEGPIPVRELRRHLADWLDNNRVFGEVSRDAMLPAPPDPLRGITATVSDLDELRQILANQPDVAVTHFIPKAQGGEIGELAWHFEGRHNERRRLTRWLNSTDQGLYAVTGEAGSGKSALLGMLYASTQPELMNALKTLGYKLDGPGLSPDTDVHFDATLHLNGQDVNDVLQGLVTALSLDPQKSDIDSVFAQIRSQAARQRLTFLADALDESRDPFTIASGVLRRLSQIQRVRVVVGTRRSLNEDPDDPKPTTQALFPALSPTEMLMLDKDESAVVSYVTNRLRQALGDGSEEYGILIGGYDKPFLFARLAVHEILADPKWHNPEQLSDLLSNGHRGIFAQAVIRLENSNPETATLLWALAYARGRGFPRADGIWSIAASALHGSRLTERHISQALQDAAPYIMIDSEFGQAAYRLAHRTFRDYYHDRNRAPAGPK